MVEKVRRGISMRRVARTFHVGFSTVRFWVKRAEGKRPCRVDWSDRPSGCRRSGNRTLEEVEVLVLTVRKQLRECSDLGEFGARAIQAELVNRGLAAPPSVRTIGRILERRGALDGRRRVRRPAPPRGWYLPDVASGKAEMDCFDIVEGLVIRDGPDVEVLNGCSLHGGLVASWPMSTVTAKTTVEALIEHWKSLGLPHYAQFDNDTPFQGPHQHRDVVSRVMRLCLSLGVTVVFAPPREPGFQATIEAFNGRWQEKVWRRFHHPSLAELQERSNRYVAAARLRAGARIEAAPERRSFPDSWTLDLQAHPRGRFVFIRRTNDQGTVTLLGRSFSLGDHWLHRLVRSEVDLDNAVIRFYALRRRDPAYQPLLCEIPYSLPKRPFKE